MNFNLSNRLEGKIALKTGITAALSWTAGVGFSNLFSRPDGLVSGLWTVITAVVVLQANLGGTYNAALQRFLGVMIGSILGAGFTWWFGASPLSLGVSIFFTVTLCALSGLKESIRIACLSVCVIMVLWGMRPEISPWSFALFRFLDSCLGILIAVTIAHTLWPAKATTLIQQDLAKTLTGLSKLYRLGASLNGDTHLTSSTHLIDDLHVLLRGSRDILEESKLEVLTHYSSLDDWKLLIGLQEELCEWISTLREIDKRNLTVIIDDDLAENLSNRCHFSRASQSIRKRNAASGIYNSADDALFRDPKRGFREI
jgi:uncharacterized membrane protein YgaE (UPF0421/DUF939 family)